MQRSTKSSSEKWAEVTAHVFVNDCLTNDTNGREGEAPALKIYSICSPGKTGERRSCGAFSAAAQRSQAWMVSTLPQRKLGRSLALPLMIALFAIFTSTPAFGQYTTGGAFATRGFRGRTPLTVNYSLEMAPSMNMGLVKVNIADTAGPSKVDRKLTVILYTHYYGYASDTIAYRYYVDLAQGMTKTELTIPFPASENQFTWDVGVFEEGRDIEDKRKNKTNNGQDYHWSYNFNQSTNLMAVAGLMATTVDPKIEVKNLKAVSNYIDSQVTAAQAALAARGGAMAGTVLSNNSLIPVDEASSDWRNYMPYPVWIASAEAAAEINDKQPQVADALRTYVSAGGTLLIYQVNSEPSMASVNRLLSGPGGNSELASWKSISQAAPAWWIINTEEEPKASAGAGSTQTPDNSKSQVIEGAGAVYDAALLTNTLLESGLGGHRDNINDLMAVIGLDDVSLRQLDDGRTRLMNSLSTDKLLEREYGRGKVMICNRRLDELMENQVSMIAQSNDDESLCVLTAKSHDGRWHWQNLILEVGKPPVWAFCALVAIFGALLGPGLLTFTARLQRRSLMIFLVPAVSFVATLAIILYGVMHEGFDTHIRIHSVTNYDGPAQVAFGWSRQNYFSGLPPRDGLQFPINAYVRPVAPDDVPYRSTFTPDPKRNLDGTVSFGEKQTWNNWLKPRQHQQLLVGHKVDPRTIPISTERNKDGKLELKNLTSMTLPLVVIRGDKDNYYFEADLGPNETREPEVQDLDTVKILVSRIAADFKPKIPPELDGGSDSLLNFGNSRRYARSYNVQASEIINDAFKRYMSDDLKLEPNQFATLVPEFDAIAIPLKGIQSDNVNLVIGVEPW